MCKKILGLFVLICMFCVQAFAAHVGNVASPALNSNGGEDRGLRVSFINDSLLERELENIDQSTMECEGDFRMLQLGVVTGDRAEFYGLFGVLADGFVSERDPWDTLGYYFDDGFAWGLGTKVILLDFGNGLRIGTDAVYRKAEVELEAISLNGVKYYKGDYPLRFDGTFAEWQFAIGVSKEFSGHNFKVVPYGGVKYSDVEVWAEASSDGETYVSPEVGSDKVFGVFFGTDLFVSDDLSVNLEGRLIDEQAVSVSCTYRF